MTNFPTALDSFTNPGPTDEMNSVTVPHDQQHANANDALTAIQAKLGINGSTNPNSIDYKLAQALATLAGKVRGTAAILSGASGGAVSLTLSFTPTTVTLTVQAPDAEGLNIYASLVGNPTNGGFSYSLSGATDRSGYVLHYEISQ